MTFKSSGAIVLTTSDQAIVTCPAATEYGLKVSLANLTSTTQAYTLKHYKAATAQTVRLCDSVPIVANIPGAFVWTLALEPGDILYGSAANANAISAFAAITNADTTGGTSALVGKGAYVAGTTYALNEMVSDLGTSYVSLQNGNIGHTPASSPAYWMVLALKGDTGATGATGATGSTGATGPANTLTVGTVTTGAPGSSAAVTIAGSAPNQTINLTIPKGDTGAAGSGSGTVTHTGAPTAGHVAVFSGSSGDVIGDGGALAAVATSGSAADLTGTLAAARLPASGVTAAGYGATGANVPSITIDGAGRVTAAVDRAITAANVGALAKAGDTATGKINLAASASGGAGLNLGSGAAPSSPVSADLWGTTAGLFYFNGTATIQFAPLASPTFTGNPTAPTPSVGDNDTSIATTAFVQAALPVKAAGTDVAGTTEDTKFVTSKALADSAAAQTLTDGATVSWNMASGYNAKVTLGGNRTLATPTNPKEGLSYMLRVIQDTTGSRTMTWPSGFDFGGAGAPTLQTGANKYDLVTLVCIDASTPKFLAFFNKGA